MTTSLAIVAGVANHCRYSRPRLEPHRHPHRNPHLSASVRPQPKLDQLEAPPSFLPQSRFVFDHNLPVVPHKAVAEVSE